MKDKIKVVLRIITAIIAAFLICSFFLAKRNYEKKHDKNPKNLDEIVRFTKETEIDKSYITEKHNVLSGGVENIDKYIVNSHYLLDHYSFEETNEIKAAINKALVWIPKLTSLNKIELKKKFEENYMEISNLLAVDSLEKLKKEIEVYKNHGYTNLKLKIDRDTLGMDPSEFDLIIETDNKSITYRVFVSQGMIQDKEFFNVSINGRKNIEIETVSDTSLNNY